MFFFILVYIFFLLIYVLFILWLLYDYNMILTLGPLPKVDSTSDGDNPILNSLWWSCNYNCRRCWTELWLWPVKVMNWSKTPTMLRTQFSPNAVNSEHWVKMWAATWGPRKTTCSKRWSCTTVWRGWGQKCHTKCTFLLLFCRFWLSVPSLLGSAGFEVVWWWNIPVSIPTSRQVSVTWGGRGCPPGAGTLHG